MKTNNRILRRVLALSSATFLGTLIYAQTQPGSTDNTKPPPITNGNSMGRTPGAPATTTTTPPSTTTQPNLPPYEIAGADMTVLAFEKGSSTIGAEADAKLKAIITNANNNPPNKEIVVIAYSDMDYPRDQKADLPKASRDLAEKRADAVKKRINDLGAPRNATTYNMATKTNWFERTFVTSDAQVKREAVEKPAQATSDDLFYQTLGQNVRTSGGAGKVVVVIRREDGKVG